MANIGTTKKNKASATQAEGKRQEEVTSTHADTMAKKTTNMVSLVDMRKENSTAPLPETNLPPYPPTGKDIMQSHKRSYSKSPVKKVAKKLQGEDRRLPFSSSRSEVSLRACTLLSAPAIFNLTSSSPPTLTTWRSWQSILARSLLSPGSTFLVAASSRRSWLETGSWPESGGP